MVLVARRHASDGMAALLVGTLAVHGAAHAADLPPFPVDPAVLARARAVKSLACDGEADVNGFALARGVPPLWHLAGATLAIRRSDRDRFAFVLDGSKADGGDCAVEDVIALPRSGQLLECTMPDGSVAGLGVHTLIERVGRRLVLYRYNGTNGLISTGEDESAMSESGEMICALPSASQWQPPQPPALAESFTGSGVLGSLLVLLGVVLTYAVLGAPLQSVAGLLVAPAVGQIRRGVGTALAALALRTALAFLTLVLLSLPGASELAGIIVVGSLIAVLWRPGRPRFTRAVEPEPPSRTAVALATLVNDCYASLAGLLCLTLLTRHNAWLLALAMTLAIFASIPAVIVGRRRLRHSPVARSGAAALLAAVVGLSVLAEIRGVGASLWMLLLGSALCALPVIGISLSPRPRPSSVS